MGTKIVTPYFSMVLGEVQFRRRRARPRGMGVRATTMRRCVLVGVGWVLVSYVVTKSAERPRRSRRGWIGVGRAGLNAQAPNNTHAVLEPSMGEGTAWVEAPA